MPEAVEYPPARGREIKVEVFNRLVTGLNLQNMADERRFQEFEKCIEVLEKRVKKLEARD